MTTAHYFVDEAGDLTLLGRRGKIVVGNEGVSQCFIVGVADIPQPEQLALEMEDLRRNLLADSYLNQIPSMQIGGGKTARCFHAKDDCSEVRMAVFKLLARNDIRIIAAVRRKIVLAELARAAFERGVKLDADSVYDDLVESLMKRTLQAADANVVCFSRRGKSTRQVALERAIRRAQENFSRDTGLPEKPTTVISAVPSDVAGLQVVDYFLWALQRLFERSDERYFNYLRSHFLLIMDLDDKRQGNREGMLYSEKNPLEKEKLLPITG